MLSFDSTETRHFRIVHSAYSVFSNSSNLFAHMHSSQLYFYKLIMDSRVADLFSCTLILTFTWFEIWQTAASHKRWKIYLHSSKWTPQTRIETEVFGLPGACSTAEQTWMRIWEADYVNKHSLFCQTLFTLVLLYLFRLKVTLSVCVW